MNPVMPVVTLPNDTSDRIMARSGNIVAVSRVKDRWKIVWRFGFLKGSDMERCFGVHVDKFLWVIATEKGRILNQFWGFSYELPTTFRQIIESPV